MTLLFDNDGAGERAKEQALAPLSEHLYVRAPRLLEGIIQPAAMTPEQVGEVLG